MDDFIKASMEKGRLDQAEVVEAYALAEEIMFVLWVQCDITTLMKDIASEMGYGRGTGSHGGNALGSLWPNTFTSVALLQQLRPAWSSLPILHSWSNALKKWSSIVWTLLVRLDKWKAVSMLFKSSPSISSLYANALPALLNVFSTAVWTFWLSGCPFCAMKAIP